MAIKLSKLFNTPPEWAAFTGLVQTLGQGDMGVDIVSVLNIITPIFKDYREITRPRYFTLQHSAANPSHKVDFYALPKGINHNEHMEYRILRLEPKGKTSVLDLNFLPKNASSKSQDIAQELYDFLKSASLESIRRSLRPHSQWVQDMQFLFQANSAFYLNNEATRNVCTRHMLQAISAQTTLSKEAKKFIEIHLYEALEAYDEKTITLTHTLLKKARAKLDPKALEILLMQPSSQTKARYNFLTQHKSPNVLARRYELAQKYPAFLLMPNFASFFNELEEIHEKDATQPILLTNLQASHDDKFLQNLREEHIGAHNAKSLKNLLTGCAWTRWFQPKTPEEWNVINASFKLADKMSLVFGHETAALRESVALNFDNNMPITLSQFESKSHIDTSVRNTQLWLNRFSALVGLRYFMEAKNADIPMPLTHALYVAGFEHSQLLRTGARSLGTLRSKLRYMRNHTYPAAKLLEPELLLHYMDNARYYATHHGENDTHLRDVVVTNRLFEHGARFKWQGLPEIYLQDEKITIKPITSQDALLKNALQFGHDLWRDGAQAITGRIHFLDIANRQGSIATVQVKEPKDENDMWGIVEISLHKGTNKRNSVAYLIEQYFNHPEFDANYNANSASLKRASLLEHIFTQAKQTEFLGINHHNPDERAALFNSFSNYMPNIVGYKPILNADECISAPALDARMEAFVKQARQAYKGLSFTP